jgi:hypothetical protein
MKEAEEKTWDLCDALEMHKLSVADLRAALGAPGFNVFEGDPRLGRGKRSILCVALHVMAGRLSDTPCLVKPVLEKMVAVDFATAKEHASEAAKEGLRMIRWSRGAPNNATLREQAERAAQIMELFSASGLLSATQETQLVRECRESEVRLPAMEAKKERLALLAAAETGRPASGAAGRGGKPSADKSRAKAARL